MRKLSGGGYDDGYTSCECFWGTEPGRLVRDLRHYFSTFKDTRVLDAGCGEGKNSYWLAKQGANVLAMDISDLALSNAYKQPSYHLNVTFRNEDFTTARILHCHFDISIAYGLFHCLANRTKVQDACARLKLCTKPGGYIVVCTMNDRRTVDRRAHPNLKHCLLPHEQYVHEFRDCEILYNTDEDLTESHPNNNITHTHAMTRLLMRRM